MMEIEGHFTAGVDPEIFELDDERATIHFLEEAKSLGTVNGVSGTNDVAGEIDVRVLECEVAIHDS